MSNINPFAVEEMPRSVMPLIFLVDTSGSMSGNKIAALNTAVREALGEVGEISCNCADALIKIAVLEFNTSVRWMDNNLVDAQSFQWQDLTAGGVTNFGEAVKQLGAKLTRKDGGFFEGACSRRAPAFILLSDGGPTDSYKNNLKELRDNRWFEVGAKVAIAIGDSADTDMLAEFTGSKESVITVHDVDQLKKIIHTVSIHTSTIGTRTSTTGGANTTIQSQVNKALQQSVATDPTLAGVDMNGSTVNSGSDDWNKGWN